MVVRHPLHQNESEKTMRMSDEMMKSMMMTDEMSGMDMMMMQECMEAWGLDP